ncbi:hypothetical protein PBI_BUTTERS_45 [Mycobacterium phage Butters]|uniref:Uncharacterized protein n=2 Tax=Charlievirus butters TaxID=2169798 RepID=A0A2Z5HEH0_9CAUD|nr:hypothetical protein K768_gp45 [Mycobacterium phage Butters]AGI12992.1 hypothetical protein PBI_BUTTERS_45 [Mycobacterium phage Butters]AXC38529.1 hypothetical protein SEA_RUBEELU_45 [Mycobacterium phage Rubeelu]
MGENSITISRDVSSSGLSRIRARGEHGTLAMALELRDYTQLGERYMWQLAVITSPRDLPEPVTYPRVDTAAEAEAWVRYLAELVLRAEQVEAVVQ